MSEKSPYPSTVFHFTNEYCTLIDSLKSRSFKLSYAKEHVDFGNENRHFAVPMVSFCDLRIKETLPHIEKYGQFGIGLSKEWATGSGLNPVLYLTNNNEISKNFITDLSQFFQILTMPGEMSEKEVANGQVLSEIYNRYLNIMRFIKNYEGILSRKGRDEFYRFADENEWRYVLPLNSDTKLGKFIKPIDQVNTQEKKKLANESIDDYDLPFSSDDIKYIIVKEDSYRDSLIDYLNTASSSALAFLKTRIITVNQIKQDF